MKKILLLTCVGVLGFLFASASGPEPGDGKGKKDDVNGIVTDSETRKPLKDVSITAYSTSTAKKEKVIITDVGGNFAFEDLKPGTYKFVFEKDGFRKVVKEKIIARTDEAFQMNIEMIEVEEFNIVPSRFFSN